VARSVFCADARAWLATNAAPPAASVVTSLPDVSEVGRAFDAWREWFLGAARQVLDWIPPDGNAIFFQSDIRHRGAWIDKGHWVQRVADDAGIPLAWHKIVCRWPPGTTLPGRASYSHMLCFSRNPTGRKPGPDVIDNGAMLWNRGMGFQACRVAIRYLVECTPTRVVVDPYCGRGTVLAIAEEMGLEAIGVELNVKRARQARAVRAPE
jgi:DNA modification methylase